jgi:hypothetical protein
MNAKGDIAVKLLIVSPESVQTVASRFRRLNLEWCYLGTEITLKSKIAGVLSGQRRIDIAEDLNRVAYEIKQPFLDWISEMGARQKDALRWWASTLASKSPLQTDFFVLICYAELVESWLNEGRNVSLRIVVVENPWLMRVFRKTYAQDERVSCHGSEWGHCLLDACYWLARIPLVTGYALFWPSWAMLVARFSFFLRKDDPVEAGRHKVLLYTWLEERCFSSSGRIRDPYMGRLDEILNKHGAHVERLTPLKIPGRFVHGVKQLPAPFVVTSRYLRIRDICGSICYWFGIDHLNQLSSFRGRDYTSLLYREMLHEWGRPVFSHYYLLYRTMRNIAAQDGHRIQCVIYPFENQPWEKMLCLAFRREASSIRLVGHQHASAPPLLLSYFLGKGESAHTPLPDYIVTNGEATRELLREGGFPAERLVNGGALRFEYLFDLKQRKEARRVLKEGEWHVLVAFPILQTPAVSLLHDLLELFPTDFMDPDRRGRVRFTLQCHPDLPLDMFKERGSALPPWFELSGRPLGELFDSVDLFLYAPPTGTWREAYWMGLPILKYLGDFLDMDSTHVLTEELPVCSRDTLKAKLYAMLTEPCSSSVEERRKLLGKVFSPVNERTWMELAGAGKVER